MSKYLFIICVSFFFLPLANSQSDLEVPRYDRIKVDLTQHTIAELAALGLEVDHGDYQKGRHFINDFSEKEIRLIETAGFEYEVLIEDMSAFYVERSTEAFENTARGGSNCTETPMTDENEYPVPSNFRLGSMAGFYYYSEMTSILDSMRLLYPHLITSRRAIDNIATHEGRPIYWLRISDNPDNDETNEDEVLYTGVHHAREPNSLTQMIYYMWYLLENYETDPEVQFIVNNTELYFMPCVNPDGYIFNEITEPDGGGLWRKNRRDNGDGTFGVDLNRNYGFEWGYDDFGSSPVTESDVYRGPSGFSEPETQAVRELCNLHNFVVTLNYHAHGNLLIYPWGYLDTPTEEAETFNTLAKIMTVENNYLAGTGTETVGYTVNGDSDDWMYGEINSKPAIYSMTPEIGDSGPGGGFWPAIANIVPNCQASMWMNLATALTPHVAVLTTPSIDLTISPFAPYLHFAVQRYGQTTGPVSIHLSSLHPEVTVVESEKIMDLPLNGMLTDSFQVSMTNNITTGTEIVFLLSTDNGSFVQVDTVRKVFSNLVATPTHEDHLDQLGQWNIENSSWDLTTEDFTSAPTSLADSPNANYTNNTTNEITLNNPIIVGAADQYLLHFWAKWDIEAFYDYTQLSVSINNGNWIPVCGRYTVDGSDLQDPGQPLYEGTQDEWVEEEINLTDLLSAGDELRIRFLLAADNFVNPDGYYVDDLVFEELNPSEPNRTTVLDENDFQIDISPNPSNGPITVKFQLPNTFNEVGQYSLYHADGRLIQQNALDFQQGAAHFILDANLPAGVYWVGAQVAAFSIPLQKVVVIK